MNIEGLNGCDLAFIGDACYELFVRTRVLMKGYTKPEDLHEKTVSYVNRISQAKAVSSIMPELTEEEAEAFKRGRNYHYKMKDNQYLSASGFEALIGYLFLTKDVTRLEYILNKAASLIEKTS